MLALSLSAENNSEHTFSLELQSKAVKYAVNSKENLCLFCLA